MKLLKPILLALLICLISACSGSKMEPINEDSVLNNNENNNEGELSLENSDTGLTLNENTGSEVSGGLSLPNNMPPTTSQHRPTPQHRPIPRPPIPATPLELSFNNPSHVPERLPAEATCPSCPQVPNPPCQSGCPQFAATPPCNSNTINMVNPFVPPQIKIVFVVDKGSHNYIPTAYSPGANDFYKATRIHHISQFFESHRNRQFSWSMITFKGAHRGWRGFARASITHENNPRKKPVFTNDHNIVLQAMNDFTLPDGPGQDRESGKIQYGAALELTKELIKEDLKTNEDDNAIYLVYFISGEAPSNRFTGRFQLDDYVYEKVKDIVDIKPERIFFSTAYYGWAYLDHQARNTRFPSVIDILEEMANIGNGEFFNLPNVRGEQIAHSDYSPNVLSSCQQQVPVTNGAICSNIVEEDYYNQNIPTLLDLPGTYSHEPVNTPPPCAAANNNLRLLPNQQPTLLPCNHTEAQHAQGIQCPLRDSTINRETSERRVRNKRRRR